MVGGGKHLTRYSWFAANILIVGLFWVFGGEPLQAQSIDFRQAEISDVERFIWDHPVLLSETASTALRELNPEITPKGWALAVWARYEVRNYLQETDAPTSKAELEQAWKIAETHGLKELAIYLKLFHRIYPGRHSLPPREVVEIFQEFIDEALKNGLLRQAARNAIDLASIHLDLGEIPESLKRLNEAEDLLQKDSNAADYDWIRFSYDGANILGAVPDLEKSLRLQSIANELCLRLQLRACHAQNLYNQGIILTRSGTLAEVETAVKLLTEALELETQLGNISGQGANYNGLAKALLRLKRHEDGADYARRSLDIYERLNEKIWKADSHLMLARHLIPMGRLDEARYHLVQAEELFPPDYLRDQYQIAATSYQLEKAQGRLSEAGEHLERSLVLIERTIRDQSSKELGVARAQIASRIEDMKRSQLQLQAELDRAKSRLYATGFSVMGLALALSIFLVWLKRQGNCRIQLLNDRIREQVLERYLPPDLVHRMIHSDDFLRQHAEERVVTVLFIDLPGLIELSTQVPIERFQQLLSQYLSSMTEVIFECGGTIDKFIGDGIMVIFGAPSLCSSQEQLQRALRCAGRMFEELERLQDSRTDALQTRLKARMGLHQGAALVGNFGSEKRFDYTAIGPTVNRAARLLRLAEPGSIYCSEKVQQAFPDLQWEFQGELEVKGIRKPLEVYRWLPEGGASVHGTCQRRTSNI